MQTWRVIFDKSYSAADNMAIDEAIWESHAANLVPPTIRFYGWSPAAVSVGYFQRIYSEVNVDLCRNKGISIVRRITGGRAVLHDRELTYSLVAREDTKSLPPNLMGSYRLISQGLIAGLKEVGVEAEMTIPTANRDNLGKMPRNGACFDAPSFYEITVDGKKLIGSAQVRREATLLQHGSLLIGFSPHDLVSLLMFKDEEDAKRCEKTLIDKATSVEDIKGYVPEKKILMAALANGLTEVLGIELDDSGLTAHEKKRAQELAKQKFGNDEWNCRR